VENATEAPQSIEEIQVKDKLKARVKQIELAGAILDIGIGHDALLHISQIRKKRVNNVRDVLEEGQEVTVWVKDIDADRNFVNVTMIKPPEISWEEVQVGQDYEGKVIRLEKFGAFVDIGAERPGLVHVSELSTEYVKSPQDVVARGEDVNVKVIGVDKEKRQIDLSMKALMEPAPVVQKRATEEPDEELPTAMAVALQRALGESAEEEEKISRRNSKKRRSDEDDIYRRTLEGQKTE